jgi:hypothetical protein
MTSTPFRIRGDSNFSRVADQVAALATEFRAERVIVETRGRRPSCASSSGSKWLPCSRG